ncbi:MAG TPA: hypothetical protein VJS40_08920 [Aestuariivirgaceae bacterium]|nr:hypothetical protein [Aestuariivirgaceae bacterium]
MSTIINNPDREPRETTHITTTGDSSAGMVLGIIVAFAVLLGIGIWGLDWNGGGDTTTVAVSPPDVVQTAPQQPAAPAPEVVPEQPAQPAQPAPSGTEGGTTGTAQ